MIRPSLWLRPPRAGHELVGIHESLIPGMKWVSRLGYFAPHWPFRNSPSYQKGRAGLVTSPTIQDRSAKILIPSRPLAGRVSRSHI